MAVGEDPHQCAERRTERDGVHDQRLYRDDDRPGHQEEQDEGRECDEGEGPRRPGRDRVLEVHENGGLAGDVGLAGCGVAAELGDEGLGGVALTRPVRYDAQHADAIAQGDRRCDRGDQAVGKLGQHVRCPGTQLLGGGSGHDGDGVCPAAGEACGEGLVHLPALELRRQQLGTAVGERDAEHRRAEHHQADRHRQRHRPGAALHSRRQSGEGAVVGQRRGGRLDPVPEHGQQRRNEGDGGEQCDENHRHARGGDRPEDRLGEHEQSAQRRRHGQCGEQDRPAGGLRRTHHGVVDGKATSAFLTEPADHEQRVVDGQAETHERRHGYDVGIEVQHRGEAEQAEERACDRGHGGDDRQARGQQPAEDEHHHDERDRQRDQFGEGDVLLYLFVDLVEEQEIPADDHVGRPVPFGLPEHRFHGGNRLVLVVQIAIQVDDEGHPLAVRGDQPLPVGRARPAHPPDAAEQL